MLPESAPDERKKRKRNALGGWMLALPERGSGERHRRLSHAGMMHGHTTPGKKWTFL